MGEIDDAQHAERQRQADRDDRVDSPEQDAIRQCLREQRQHIH